MRALLVVLLATLAACGPVKAERVDQGDNGGEGGDTAGGDEGGADDTGGGESGLTAWLHEDFPTLVYVAWEQESAATTWVEYSFDEGEWLSTPPRTVEAGPQEALLLGVPYATEVTFRLVSDDGTGEVRTPSDRLTTGDLPADLPEVTLLTYSEADVEPTGVYLLGSVNAQAVGWSEGDYWKFIVDRQGRYVWASLTEDHHWTLWMTVSTDGGWLLWDKATYWADWDGGAHSKVYKMKIDGSGLESYSTPGLHHAFLELPDGTLVWGAADGGWETLEALDPKGTQTQIWDCQRYHAEVGIRDQCQSNALFWNADTDTFLYSFYTTEAVLEIDHATGEVIRQFGHLDDSYAFNPEESAFWWQHGVGYTESGTLLVSTHASDRTAQVVPREYSLDGTSEELTMVWEAGYDDPVESSTNGDVHRLPNGNTLHNTGDGGRIREFSADGTVVWDVDWGSRHLLGRSVFIEDLYDLAP